MCLHAPALPYTNGLSTRSMTRPFSIRTLAGGGGGAIGVITRGVGEAAGGEGDGDGDTEGAAAAPVFIASEADAGAAAPAALMTTEDGCRGRGERTGALRQTETS